MIYFKFFSLSLMYETPLVIRSCKYYNLYWFLNDIYLYIVIYKSVYSFAGPDDYIFIMIFIIVVSVITAMFTWLLHTEVYQLTVRWPPKPRLVEPLQYWVTLATVWWPSQWWGYQYYVRMTELEILWSSHDMLTPSTFWWPVSLQHVTKRRWSTREV